ncbi:MAG: hypothetical protein FIB07_15870 [Candidatus Methanoperedens sp.]|nr:hypothetical protein [Candidatus Methanoperedens sp.]
MKKTTTKEMFEIYRKYALKDGAQGSAPAGTRYEEHIIDMWTDDDEAEDFRVQSTAAMKDLIESINAENLTTEEKIYIALKVGMLM